MVNEQNTAPSHPKIREQAIVRNLGTLCRIPLIYLLSGSARFHQELFSARTLDGHEALLLRPPGLQRQKETWAVALEDT